LKPVFTIVTCLFVLTCAGQIESSLQSDSLYKAMKVRTRITKRKFKFFFNNTDTKAFFNRQGQLIETLDYGLSGKEVRYRALYTYDTSRKLVKVEQNAFTGGSFRFSFKLGSVKSIISFLEYSDGKLVKRSTFGATNNVLYAHEFYKNGNIRRVYYDSARNIDSYTETTYKNDGEVYKILSYGNKADTTVWKNEYDGYGRLQRSFVPRDEMNIYYHYEKTGLLSEVQYKYYNRGSEKFIYEFWD